MCKHVMGNTPLWNRPSNDKYAFLCVFHTLLKGKKKRRSSSSQQQLVPTVSLHPVLPKRSRKMLHFFSPKLCRNYARQRRLFQGTTTSDDPLFFFGPLMGPRTVFGICHRSAVLSWNSRQGAVEEFRLDNSVSYAFDDDLNMLKWWNIFK